MTIILLPFTKASKCGFQFPLPVSTLSTFAKTATVKNDFFIVFCSCSTFDTLTVINFYDIIDANLDPVKAIIMMNRRGRWAGTTSIGHLSMSFLKHTKDTTAPTSCKVQLRSEYEKTAHAQKLANNKESTIFVQSSWNLIKMITSWGNHFHQVSWGWDKNCGFFIIGQFLCVCGFFLLRPYIQSLYCFKATNFV